MNGQTVGTIAARMDRLPASKWHKKIIAYFRGQVYYVTH